MHGLKKTADNFPVGVPITQQQVNLLANIFCKIRNFKIMIKEAKNIDFYTSGRQPSEQDFARISEWIRKNKKKEVASSPKQQRVKKRTSSNKLARVKAIS